MSRQNKIYYLHLETARPKWYERLAEYFTYQDIFLIPVNFNDLKEFAGNEKIHVIVSESSFEAKEAFERQNHGFLGFALRNNFFHIHHISSFQMTRDLVELRDKKNYYFYKLPFSMAAFSLHVANEFFDSHQKVQKWPGGRRAKLPAA